MAQGIFDRIKSWARTLKRDIHALWLAARDPRTPIAPKAVALLVAGYALSPIDLIPDFIPVLGYLDDLVLVPLGIMLAVRLVPAEMMAACRERAVTASQRPVSRIAAGLAVCAWIAGALVFGAWLLG